MIHLCKNCGTPFRRVWGGQRHHCKSECRIAFNGRHNKLRYRNDPAFREAQKARVLQSYYHRKGGE